MLRGIIPIAGRTIMTYLMVEVKYDTLPRHMCHGQNSCCLIIIWVSPSKHIKSYEIHGINLMIHHLSPWWLPNGQFLCIKFRPKWAMASSKLSQSLPGLVNSPKKRWKITMLSSWENSLFRLGHGFQFANCECHVYQRVVFQTPTILYYTIFFDYQQMGMYDW